MVGGTLRSQKPQSTEDHANEMSDNYNPAQPVGHEAPPSTTEEVLRVLSEHCKFLNSDDDVLTNPELEQLFCSLLKGLGEGIPDSALGVQPAGPLTLEDLGAGLGPPLALGQMPSPPTAREADVACYNCGVANPAATPFCGMCGHDLAKSASGTKVFGNETEPAAALRAVPKAVTPQPAAAVHRSSSLGLKLACLALFCIALGPVVYQRQLRRESPLVKWISSSPTMSSVPPSVVVPPAPAKTAVDPVPESPLQVPAIPQPNTPARPLKTAPPTTVRQALIGPALLDSPAPQPGKLPAPIHVPDNTPSAADALVPAERAPVQAASTPASPAPIKVSQGVVQGALVFKVTPEYPAVARAARVQGSVLMHALIGTDGTLEQLQVISGNPLLVPSALEAVKKWRYRPYLLDGTPVEIETNITINFKGE
jgi:periplasmic protein TonB